MSKQLLAALTASCIAVLLLATSAQAAFDVTSFDVTYENQDSSPVTQAGSHPFAMSTDINFSYKEETGEGGSSFAPDGSPKDLTVKLPAGLIGDREAVPFCSTADFLKVDATKSSCPDSSAIGVLYVRVPGQTDKVTNDYSPAYNLAPPPGAAAKIGFIVQNVPVALLIRVNPEPPYNLVASLQNTSSSVTVGGSRLSIWGNPADSVHDGDRGRCLGSGKLCPVDLSRKPYLTLPRSCTGPLVTSYEANSWETPEVFVTGKSESHDDTTPPNPQGLSGCGKLAFGPTISAKPTSLAAQSPTGLDFSLDVFDEGLKNPEGLASTDVRKAVVTLPEGMSVNPSIAEGLEVCSKAQLERETVFSSPGEGCPNASKIGSVKVETPLLDESVDGGLYQATPYDNHAGSLIALYLVIKNPNLGIIVKQTLKVEADPVTGRLTTVADEIPQLPFSHFRLHFREGARSPLATPPGCGTHNVQATLYPWSGGAPVTTNSAFEVITGPESKPCPTGGLPPFRPGLEAGTLNNAAGRFSPFNVRLFRTDSEQEFTRFSIKLPPGIAGILAGVPYCPEAGIAQAKARTGPLGGHEELADPSCPAASEIGRSLAGAGVGSALAYAPGKIYLAGPYKGTAFSLVAITAGVVGPFDIGTVVIRQGFKVDRETAEVFIDSTESDPIPHIIKGIPVHARDIRAYVDRSKFVFNPTNCERTSTASTLLGSGLDFGSQADDRPVTVSTPFQAADCAALRFQPKLKLQLKGGTKRGDFPAFKAVLKMNGGPEKGEANVARAQVTLPKSAFLEQGHIKTICTRVQFRADKCPPGSIYGFARAYTPVLAEPVEGPVYLRSSEHELPDIVASLHSEKIIVDLVGRVDSLNGRIRTTFEAAPDAPISKFVFTMRGGKKGLIVNSTNLCKGTHKAIADFTAQNGKVSNTRPAVSAKCPKGSKGSNAKKQR